MAEARPHETIAEGRPMSTRRWWPGTTALGVACVLAPAVALVVTNRDPDPRFMHAWWSPIASTPAFALLVGSFGLDLLLATGATAVLMRLMPYRRRRPGLLPVAMTAALALVGCIIWIACTAPTAGSSTSAVHAILDHEAPRAARASSQAQRAMQLALGLPGSPTSGVRVLDRGRTPAGPWVVQTVEIVNDDLPDEHADVSLETLVDPRTGAIESAWFSGP